MDSAVFLSFAKSASLLLSLCLLQGFIWKRWPNREPAGLVLSGLLYGFICIVGMEAPIVVAPGVIFDFRSVIVGLAGAFGGARVGAIAALLAGGYRAWLGGTGAPVGVAVVVVSFLIGLAFHFLRRQGRLQLNVFWLFGLGLVIHLVVAYLFTYLPENVVDRVLDTIVLPMVIVASPATAVLGYVLLVIERGIRNEIALAESERKLRDLAQCSSDWFWEMGPDLRFTAFSEGAAEVTGVPVDFHVGKTRQELAADDVNSEHWRRHLDDLNNRRPFKNFQFLRRGHDGRTQYILTSGVPVFSSDGEFKGYRGTGSDITDRIRLEKTLRDREASLQAIFDNTPICMNLKDTEGRYVFLNKPYEEWLGHSAEEIVGKKASEFLENAEEVNNLTAAERKVLETGEVFEGEIQVTRPNGETYDRILIKFPVKADDGEIIGLGTVAIDITERNRAAEALRQAMVQAENASKSKSDFLASMSHELRTPLNAELGYGQMLELDLEKTLTATQKEYVKNIISSGGLVLELINDLLDLARIESDRVSVFLETFAPHEVVEECISRMALFADKNKVTIELAPCQPDGVSIISDRLRLRQILINLISNAIKYNKPDGRVHVTCSVLDDGFFRVSIADTGIGIAAANYDRLFKLFHRATEDPMHAVEGTGVGLFVSKKLADRLGARIEFESREGAGSTFWIDVPLASNDEVLIWTDDLRVGVDAIDKDHQIIFSLTNAVSTETIETDDLGAVIEEMIDYTSYHFRREEAIMEVCGYPDLAGHKERHHELERHVQELAAEWRARGSTEILHRLKSFLRNWWSRHIVDVDTTIAKHAAGFETEIEERLAKIPGRNGGSRR